MAMFPKQHSERCIPQTVSQITFLKGALKKYIFEKVI